jgi:hypothetical protein
MIRKIKPDKERAKSLLKMAIESEKLRKKMLISLKKEKNQTFIAQSYYESIRQLVMSLMLSKGLKPLGDNAHKETLDYLKKYKQFGEQEIFIMQDLRMRRNKGMYEGKVIKKPYIENNMEKLESIIQKLKEILDEELK